jgi:hypothetical protein
MYLKQLGSFRQHVDVQGEVEVAPDMDDSPHELGVEVVRVGGVLVARLCPVRKIKIFVNLHL